MDMTEPDLPDDGKDRAPLHVWLPAALDLRLREEAQREQRTVTATVQLALRYYLDRKRTDL